MRRGSALARGRGAGARTNVTAHDTAARVHPGDDHAPVIVIGDQDRRRDIGLDRGHVTDTAVTVVATGMI